MTPQQALYMRSLIEHFTTKLGIRLDDFANASGIHPERLDAFFYGITDDLPREDIQRFVDLGNDLSAGEAEDVLDAQRSGVAPPRTAKQLFQELVAQQENKQFYAKP